MRLLLIAGLLLLLAGCNNSGKKKDPNKQMDDTARMDQPPVSETIPVNPVKITAADIPATIKTKGKFQEGWKWTDKLGENIFFTTLYETPVRTDKWGDESQSAELFAFLYLKSGSGDFVKRWQLTDGVPDCSFDLTCAFLPGSMTVTDLDQDGIAETKVQYQMACRSDVSPAYMKLVLHEDTVKYVLRGNQWLAWDPAMKFEVTAENVNLEKMPPGKDDLEQLLKSSGRYENEKDFTGAPPAFLPFARTEWLKFAKEKTEEF